MHTRILSIGAIFSEQDNSSLHLYMNATSHAANTLSPHKILDPSPSSQGAIPPSSYSATHTASHITTHAATHAATYAATSSSQCAIKTRADCSQFANSETRPRTHQAMRVDGQPLSPRGEGLTPASLARVDVHAVGRMKTTTFALER